MTRRTQGSRRSAR
uniref:Uncharacterized protein n=1 Tax=Arundo donax TaxID=35708 RepID=A0A0A9E684_ARUDO